VTGFQVASVHSIRLLSAIARYPLAACDHIEHTFASGSVGKWRKTSSKHPLGGIALSFWMHTLVVDTTELYAAIRDQAGYSVPADGPFAKAIARCRGGELALAINQLVLQEARSLLLRDCDATNGRSRAARARRLLALPADASESVVRHRLFIWQADVTSFLREQGVRIHGIPEVEQQAIVERLLWARRPFSGRGDDGYRDALLWEFAVRLAEAGERVVLVSRDKAAFQGADAGLHLSLREELQQRCGDSRAVSLAPTMTRALGVAAKPAAAVPGVSARWRDASDDESIAELTMLIADFAVDLPGKVDPYVRELIGVPVTGVTLEGLVDLHDVAIRRLGKHELYARVLYEGRVRASAPSEAAPDPPLELKGLDLGRSWVSDQWFASFESPVEVEALATLEATGELWDVSVTGWSLAGDMAGPAEGQLLLA
jgi:hypothetical protein